MALCLRGQILVLLTQLLDPSLIKISYVIIDLPSDVVEDGSPKEMGVNGISNATQ